MGWTVLYIAFGIVALWLLGEVLLQYKARLRWRVLAFVGFLCVVAGALIPSVLVIGVGIAAFATGQTFVTLSYRRGFVAGWALTGVPGVGGRRDEEPEPEPEPELQQAPGFEALDAPEPVPALAAAGGGFGGGPDAFGQGPEQGALEPGGFETAAMPALDSMGAPPGYGTGQNRYDSTETFAAVDTMSAPDGFGGNFGTDGGGYNPNANGNRYDNPNGNGYDAAAFAGGDAFGGGMSGGGLNGGMNGGMNGGGMNGAPNGFDGTQTFSSPFAPEPDGYQTGSFPGADVYGADPGGQQVPVYQPGPLPEEMTTGDFPIPGAYDAYSPYQGGGQNGIYQDAGPSYGQNAQFADPYSGFDPNQASPYDSYGNGFDGYGGGYDAGQQGYGPQASPYGVSDTFGGGGGFGAGSQGADAYGSMYGNGETYADGQSYFPQAQGDGAAWVPQQRDPNEQMYPQDQQQYGYQNADPYGYGTQGGNGYGYY